MLYSNLETVHLQAEEILYFLVKKMQTMVLHNAPQ